MQSYRLFIAVLLLAFDFHLTLAQESKGIISPGQAIADTITSADDQDAASYHTYELGNVSEDQIITVQINSASELGGLGLLVDLYDSAGNVLYPFDTYTNDSEELQLLVYRLSGPAPYRLRLTAPYYGAEQRQYTLSVVADDLLLRNVRGKLKVGDTAKGTLSTTVAEPVLYMLDVPDKQTVTVRLENQVNGLSFALRRRGEPDVIPVVASFDGPITAVYELHGPQSYQLQIFPITTDPTLYDYTLAISAGDQLTDLRGTLAPGQTITATLPEDAERVIAYTLEGIETDQTYLVRTEGDRRELVWTAIRHLKGSGYEFTFRDAEYYAYRFTGGEPYIMEIRGSDYGGEYRISLLVACTVTARGNVNRREGPGTNFESVGTLEAGYPVVIVGKTTGSDGKVWYRLGVDSWVRSDVVALSGDCANLPVVQEQE